MKKFTIFCLIAGVAGTFLLLDLPAGWVCAETTTLQAKEPLLHQHLRRADFRVTGISCASCLHRVAREIIVSPGVIKADVSVFHPYLGVVIYNSDKTSIKKVFEAVTDKTVKFVDIKDGDISEIPAVVVPK